MKALSASMIFSVLVYIAITLTKIKDILEDNTERKE